MQVLIIAVIMGVAIVMLPEEKRTPVRNWFVSMADLVMSIISIALKLAPIGVFCLMANALGNTASTCCSPCPSFRYLLFVLHPSSDSGILFDFMAVYRHYPSEFLERSFPTIAAAASTCSSAAVIPVSMNVAKENFEVEDSVAGLGITLGGTINKDGVAVLCSVVILFSAQAMGIALTPGQILIRFCNSSGYLHWFRCSGRRPDESYDCSGGSGNSSGDCNYGRRLLPIL